MALDQLLALFTVRSLHCRAVCIRHHPLLPAKGRALYLASKWNFCTDHKWSREGGKSKDRLVCHT